jgi:hypothetical protein
LKLALDSFIDKERLHHRGWIGQAGSLDHEGIELGPVLEELEQAPQQVAANGAADTTVAHFNDFLFRGNQQMMIDANLAEFVDDDRNTTAVLSGQNTIQEGCFACAEKPGQDGYWNSFIICFGHRLEILLQLFCKGNTDFP